MAKWLKIAGAVLTAATVCFTILFLTLRDSALMTAAFIITSVLSALMDMIFVVMQRYNRPRVVRLAERSKRKANGSVTRSIESL